MFPLLPALILLLLHGPAQLRPRVDVGLSGEPRVTVPARADRVRGSLIAELIRKLPVASVLALLASPRYSENAQCAELDRASLLGHQADTPIGPTSSTQRDRDGPAEA